MRGRRRGAPGSTSPDSSSLEGLQQRVGEPAGARRSARGRRAAPPRSARRTTSARWTSVATGRRSGSPARSSAKRSSNVPIAPASRQPHRASRSRSTRSTSDRFGTIRVRLVVEARQIALQEERDLARMRRPREEAAAPPSHRRAAAGRVPGRSRRITTLYAAAAPFGRRPRRAPRGPASSRRSRRRGRPPSSHGARRREVTRSDAPRASSTSFAQLSQTRTVFRAIEFRLLRQVFCTAV